MVLSKRDLFKGFIATISACICCSFQTSAKNSDKSTIEKDRKLQIEDEKSPKSIHKPMKDCRYEFMKPKGNLGGFRNDGDFYFHLSAVDQTRPAKNGMPRFRYKLMGLQMSDLKLKMMMSMVLPRIDAVIYQGNPLEGIIAVSFMNSLKHCRSGLGFYAGIATLNDKKNRKLKLLRDKGHFVITSTPEGETLFDTEKNSLIFIDFKSFQMRRQRLRLNTNERPLYVNLSQRHSYVWNWGGGLGDLGLVAYAGENNPIAKLKFKRGDRLIHQGKFFGAAQVGASQNSLNILRLQKWSNINATSVFTIFVQKKYPIENAALEISFKSPYAAIYGFNDAINKKWRKVLIYNYQKGALISQLDVDSRHFPAGVAMSPDGRSFVVEVRRRSDGITSHFSIFLSKTKRWVDLRVSSAQSAKR